MEKLAWTGIIVNIAHMDSFIKDKIIYPLSRKRQFGVLYLSSEDDIDCVPEEDLELYPRYYSWLYDIEKLFPVHQRYYNNYLLARLSKKKELSGFTGKRHQIHVEEKLLTEFRELWNAYRKRYMAVPNHVILYTWLSPCRVCTDRIVGCFRCLPTSTTKSVVYSANYGKMSPKENKDLRQILTDAGINVVHVKVPRSADYSHSAVPVYT